MALSRHILKKKRTRVLTAHPSSVVALSGGIGGAKLALGLDRVLDTGKLTVICNTGDDFYHLGLHIWVLFPNDPFHYAYQFLIALLCRIHFYH